MTIQRHWLITGAAVIVALGLGFGAARMLNPAAPDDHATAADHDDHDEEAEEGFVALAPEDATAAGVMLAEVERGGGAGLKLPGRVAFAPGAEAAVDAPLSGSVIRVHVGPGDRVTAGQALAVLRSPEGAASRATVDAAAAALEMAQAAERRDRTLHEQGWVAQARLDISAAEARRAEAELRAARARAGAHGGPGADGLVTVRSPIAGVVTRVAAAPGQFLHEEALQVATVADPRRIELVFDAPPAVATMIRVGDRLEVSLPEGGILTGVVIAVAPAENSGMAVRVRPDSAAPPVGAVISARVLSGPDASSDVLSVPLEAVQTIDGRASVFVAEGGGFRARPVTTGRTFEQRVEILSGLDGGERIAGEGAFLLKAQLARGEADHGH